MFISNQDNLPRQRAKKAEKERSAAILDNAEIGLDLVVSLNDATETIIALNERIITLQEEIAGLKAQMGGK
ncbi:hypothetical protein [Anaerovibrio slackiae]|uniref:hypothetical protein n=1 Tax=Anaerovibrio slackiae TaxID=2652309 RepID=UPI0038686C42